MGPPDATPLPPNPSASDGPPVTALIGIAVLASIVLSGGVCLWIGGAFSSHQFLTPLLALSGFASLVALAIGVLTSRLQGSIAAPLHLRIAELEDRREVFVQDRSRLETATDGTAKAIDSVRSEFLASLSHEIRTPLNGIMVMAELLSAANLDQRQQRYAEVIVKSGQSLLSVIDDMPDPSAMESAEIRLECVEVDPVTIADDVTSLFWEHAASKELDLATRVSPRVPALVLGDPVRLNQLLSNLVNNALAFTDKGQILVTLHYEAGCLSITVAGGSPGAMPRVTGFGPGLALSKRLVKAMGGSLSQSGEPGRGPTFIARLPLQAVKAQAPLAPPLQGFDRAGLAMEGRASLSALGTALMASGYRVSEVTAGAADVDVLFVSEGQLDHFRFEGQSRPRIVCLAKLGDSRGDTAVAAGEADDLLFMPLRHADIRAILTGLAAGKLPGRATTPGMENKFSPVRSFPGRHILVADDSAVNREVIIEVLRQMSITVETAVNGIEAVACWKRRKPDLVFMDCSMPLMDGFAATREIRAHEKLSLSDQRTPIVALTANVAGGTADHWQEAGMDAYLTKPFTIATIVHCLENLFAGAPPAPAVVDVAPGRKDVLDSSVIAELRNIGGNDQLFRRVLELFVSRVPPAMDRVHNLRQSSDLTALADATHALKSMCANIGAKHAMAVCDELETAARTGADFDVGEMIAQISHEMHQVLQEIDRLRAA